MKDKFAFFKAYKNPIPKRRKLVAKRPFLQAKRALLKNPCKLDRVSFSTPEKERGSFASAACRFLFLSVLPWCRPLASPWFTLLTHLRKSSTVSKGLQKGRPLARCTVLLRLFVIWCVQPACREQKRHIRKNHINFLKTSWMAGCPWDTRPVSRQKCPFLSVFLK